MSNYFNVEEYKKDRRNFYTQFENMPYNLSGNEYALFLVKGHKQSEVDKLREVAKKVWDVYSTAYNQIIQMEKEDLLKIGYFPEVIEYITTGCDPYSFLARLDLVMLKDGGIKLLENNSDTPFLEIEAFEMNGKVSTNFGVKDPNANNKNDITNYYLEELKWMAKEKGKALQDITVVLTGKMSNEEEAQQLMFLERVLGQYVHIKYVNIGELVICAEETMHRYSEEEDYIRFERGVYMENTEGRLEEIDVLIRMAHPMDYLVRDKAYVEDSWEEEVKQEVYDYQIGVDLLALYYEGRVHLLNPPESFVMQPKSVMALIWDWKDRNDIFTLEQKAVIEEHFLPTYLEPTKFIENNIPYVQKANLGREGNTVKIFDKDNNLVTKSYSDIYGKNGYVYQQYIELPTVQMGTEKGLKEGSYVHGVFVIHDEPSAIAIRAGGKITGFDSYWLACGIVD